VIRRDLDVLVVVEFLDEDERRWTGVVFLMYIACDADAVVLTDNRRRQQHPERVVTAHQQHVYITRHNHACNRDLN